MGINDVLTSDFMFSKESVLVYFILEYFFDNNQEQSLSNKFPLWKETSQQPHGCGTVETVPGW